MGGGLISEGRGGHRDSGACGCRWVAGVPGDQEGLGVEYRVGGGVACGWMLDGVLWELVGRHCEEGGGRWRVLIYRDSKACPDAVETGAEG